MQDLFHFIAFMFSFFIFIKFIIGLYEEYRFNKRDKVVGLRKLKCW